MEKALMFQYYNKLIRVKITTKVEKKKITRLMKVEEPLPLCAHQWQSLGNPNYNTTPFKCLGVYLNYV